jgi:hypothetical protein
MLIHSREGSLYSGAFRRIDLHQDGWDAPQYAAIRRMCTSDGESKAIAVRDDGHERL